MAVGLIVSNMEVKGQMGQVTKWPTLAEVCALFVLLVFNGNRMRTL